MVHIDLFLSSIDRDHCREDYLEIYDGPTAESPLIGRFCGRQAPEVTASGSHMFLVFNTGDEAPPYGHVGFYANAISITKGKRISAFNLFCWKLYHLFPNHVFCLLIYIELAILQ